MSVPQGGQVVRPPAPAGPRRTTQRSRQIKGPSRHPNPVASEPGPQCEGIAVSESPPSSIGRHQPRLLPPLLGASAPVALVPSHTSCCQVSKQKTERFTSSAKRLHCSSWTPAFSQGTKRSGTRLVAHMGKVPAAPPSARPSRQHLQRGPIPVPKVPLPSSSAGESRAQVCCRCPPSMQWALESKAMGEEERGWAGSGEGAQAPIGLQEVLRRCGRPLKTTFGSKVRSADLNAFAEGVSRV